MSSVVRPNLEARAIRDLRFVNSALQRVGLPMWLELDLPTAQFKALLALASTDGVSVTGLARSLSIGEPAASQLVEQLVRRGYAQRASDVSDRRKLVVSATPVGAELVSGLLQGRQHHMEHWLASMNDGDVDALARGLAALAAAVASEDADA